MVLGLIFLKYVSDAFEEKHRELEEQVADPASDYYVKDPAAWYAVLEDRDEYLAENVFWVPQEARWARLQASAKTPEIGRLIDDAMVAIERENPPLKGVLPKDYARPTLDKTRLGELLDLVGTIGLGDRENRSKDILGRVYEYFLGQFAGAEGRRGGEFLYAALCGTPPGRDDRAISRTGLRSLLRLVRACSSNLKSLSASTAADSGISRSTGRRPTPQRGVFPA